MEGLIALAVLVIVALGLVGPILAIVALVKASRAERETRDLGTTVAVLKRRLEVLGRSARPAEEPGATPAPPPEPSVVAEAGGPAEVPSIGVPTPTQEPPARPAEPAMARSPEPPPRPPRPAAHVPPPPPAADFATNLGPKILVATGALAFVIFLAFFVKYAWENDWVGPAGRVLSGAVMGLGLVAGGVRLLGREYRPLGQGLAGAGLASLYLSAFAAHGVYELIPRQAAGLFMALITACAVILAARLDARLLASLAWVGGYLTPVLLSTGEDKVVALYLYLTLLNLGALVLDHKRPWMETLPFAMVGTLVLYAGWYLQFFRADRFGVAAFGVVLFTAMFALGAARKERTAILGPLFSAAALGLAILAGGADRPEWLLVLSIALGGAVLFLARDLHPVLSLVAPVAVGLPLLVWALAHYRSASFDLAAAWVVGGLLLFVLARTGQGMLDWGLPAAALLAGGLASVALAAQTDRPAQLAVFLAAGAGVAILARNRFAGSEVVGSLAAAFSVLAWFTSFFDATRNGDAYLLTLPAAAIFLLALVVRGLALPEPLDKPSLATHLIVATWTWTVLFHTLYDSNPLILGLVSVALAAVYLTLGLIALDRKPDDGLQVRAWLGLATVFLTIAIPVQLGLHGITMAWAVEGVVLLALGCRFESLWTRLGAYLVLAATGVRLFARHLPLHRGDFTPVLNPPFAIWMVVVLALAGAVYLTRERREGLPDRIGRPALATAALVLLFLALSAETWDSVIQLGGLGYMTARRWAGVALSALWTLFATGLLAGGLGLRSRPLFYSSYALFAATATKVVLVDLATFPTLFRMFSFLALALLLLAGAFLNLRFRDRLLPKGEGR